MSPDLVLRQAQDEVLRGITSAIDLMVSLSNHVAESLYQMEPANV
jgi:hypothetical protein